MATCSHSDIYAHNDTVKPPEQPVRTRSQSAGLISYAWLSSLHSLRLHARLMYGIGRVGNKPETDKVKLMQMQGKHSGMDRGH